MNHTHFFQPGTACQTAPAFLFLWLHSCLSQLCAHSISISPPNYITQHIWKWFLYANKSYKNNSNDSNLLRSSQVCGFAAISNHTAVTWYLRQSPPSHQPVLVIHNGLYSDAAAKKVNNFYKGPPNDINRSMEKTQVPQKSIQIFRHNWYYGEFTTKSHFEGISSSNSDPVSCN